MIRFHSKLLLLIISLSLMTFEAKGQAVKIDLFGHLQSLNTIWIKDVQSQWYSMGSIYNRLNLKLYLRDQWSFNASARNVFNYGQLLYHNYPYYTEMLVRDEGMFDLTGTIKSDSSYLFYSNIDRAYMHFRIDQFELTLGRQRINWGVNMVWNPNDIFNTFNFYDFDYVERPGCDALRVEYFSSHASSLQAAIKMDASEKITAAAMYKYNRWNYDFQLLSGVMKDDIVVGGGWSGYIFDAGFSGEVAYFRNQKNRRDTSGTLILSTTANYTFINSTFIHAAIFYNSKGTTGKAGWGNSFLYLQDLSPKTFSRARYSLFGQISYPLSPLISTDLSSVFNPADGSLFFGPNLDISLSDNISLLLLAQIFLGETGSEFGDYGKLIYTRLKWSF